MNTLTASSDVPWALTSTCGWCTAPSRFALRCGSLGGRSTASSACPRTRPATRNGSKLPHQGAARVEEGQAAWPELNYSTAPGVLILHPSIPTIAPLQSRSANKLICPFLASQRPVSGLCAPGWTLGMPRATQGPQGRKSPVSTGLCESGQFSTVKVKTLGLTKYGQSEDPPLPNTVKVKTHTSSRRTSS